MINFYDKITILFYDAAIQQLYLDEKLPAPGHIDLYRSQDQNPELFELFSLPALLLDWTIDHRENRANITVHVCFESPTERTSHDFLRFVELTRNVLDGLESSSTGKLQIVSENLHDMSGIIETVQLNFECSYYPTRTHIHYVDHFEHLNLNSNLTIKTND